MTPTQRRDDVPTLWAVGASVAVIASLAHEMLGHGLGCLADGGSIRLVTFLVFRCQGGGALADGGGPIGALFVAVLALVLFRISGPRRSVLRLFLLTLGVLTLFWVNAQMVREAMDGSDDWGYVARDLGWPPLWRALLGAIGIAGYLATLRIAAGLGRGFADGRPARLALPYLAAVVSAVFLGALWHGDRAASALDGFMCFGVAPLGYLLVIRTIGREGAKTDSEPIERNKAWLIGASILFVIFAMTIARGVGPLA